MHSEDGCNCEPEDNSFKWLMICFMVISVGGSAIALGGHYFDNQTKIACYEAAKANPKIECPK